MILTENLARTSGEVFFYIRKGRFANTIYILAVSLEVVLVRLNHLLNDGTHTNFEF